MHKVPIPLYLFPLLEQTVLYKITSEYIGTHEKRTPQLPVTHNLAVRFADKNSKSLLKMTLELLCLNKFSVVPIIQLHNYFLTNLVIN